MFCLTVALQSSKSFINVISSWSFVALQCYNRSLNTVEYIFPAFSESLQVQDQYVQLVTFRIPLSLLTIHLCSVHTCCTRSRKMPKLVKKNLRTYLSIHTCSDLVLSKHFIAATFQELLDTFLTDCCGFF